jgi:hypothetical protein
VTRNTKNSGDGVFSASATLHKKLVSKP